MPPNAELSSRCNIIVAIRPAPKPADDDPIVQRAIEAFKQRQERAD